MPTPRRKKTQPAERDDGAATRDTFDLAYYDHFYVDPSTRVDDEAHHASLVTYVVSVIEYFGGDLTTVLDVGAGMGRWRAWLAKHRPDVVVRSTEMDPAVCAKFGHEQRDISKWHAKKKFDLVVCQGVLPYLDDAACSAALENLAAMCGGFFYLEAITKRDLEEVCDRGRTDFRVHGRTGAWYRTRLRKHFVEVGAGLFYVKGGDLPLFELEAR